MSLELKVLQALAQSRELLSVVETHQQIYKGLFSTLGSNVLREVCAYYTRDSEATCVDKDIFTSAMASKLKNIPNKEVALLLIERLFEPVSVPNIHRLILDFKMEVMGEEILKLVSQKKWDNLPRLMNKLSELVEGKANESYTKDVTVLNNVLLSDLLNNENTSRIFKLSPQSLNDAVGGGAKRGHHIGIVALPEAGKSLVAINMLTSFCEQGYIVLYVGNEDPLNSIAIRFTCRFIRQPEDVILSNISDTQDKLNATGYNNLYIVSLPFSSTSAILKLVEEYKPDVLCVDQLRNVVCEEGGDGLTSTLETASKYMRNLAKKYNLLAISVTQAGDCATNKLVLDRSDVDSSKIGFDAPLDLMIGVGVNQEFYDQNKRMLSLKGKNKLSGKHIFFPVRINKMTNEVSDL